MRPSATAILLSIGLWMPGRWNDPVSDWLASHGAEGRLPRYTSTRLPWVGFYVMRSG
jgi:hypothetical protein